MLKMENIDKGNIIILRDGTEKAVEFIGYMPDDLHIGYEYVIKLEGCEASSYTEEGLWSSETESTMDIIEIKSAFKFGYDAHAKNLNFPYEDQAFIDTLLKNLGMRECLDILNEWHAGFEAAHETYLRKEFPEMYQS